MLMFLVLRWKSFAETHFIKKIQVFWGTFLKGIKHLKLSYLHHFCKTVRWMAEMFPVISLIRKSWCFVLQGVDFYMWRNVMHPKCLEMLRRGCSFFLFKSHLASKNVSDKGLFKLIFNFYVCDWTEKKWRTTLRKIRKLEDQTEMTIETELRLNRDWAETEQRETWERAETLDRTETRDTPKIELRLNVDKIESELKQNGEGLTLETDLRRN